MLKKGDTVVMHTCIEAEFYKGTIWTCQGNEFTSASGTQVVFLEGFSGYFMVEYLQLIDLTPYNEKIAFLNGKADLYKAKIKSMREERKINR